MVNVVNGGLFGFSDEPAESGRLIEVVFDAGVDERFSYVLPERFGAVKRFCRVEVPFGRGNKAKDGFCVGLDVERPAGVKLKAVRRVIDEAPLLDEGLFALAEWVSGYYVCPLGQVLAAMLPAAVKNGTGPAVRRFLYLLEGYDDAKLSSGQQRRIVEFLRVRGADREERAVEKSEAIAEAGTTAGPVKTLVKKGVVRSFEKEVEVEIGGGGVRGATVFDNDDIELNAGQMRALEAVKCKLDEGGFGVSLLQGVTGSGKTEVYLRAIADVLERGGSAIVLLPEIALTAQAVERYRRRFGESVAVLHSGLTASERAGQWYKIRRGRGRIVVGARSAIFAPVRELGLVVVDEEHEPSYKQDTVPRYHGRDTAIKRAQLAGAHIILGSATPSMESLHNSRVRDSYQLLELPLRVVGCGMPEMRLVEMAEQFSHINAGMLSDELCDAIGGALVSGRQVMLLLNRRGYSHYIYCPRCRYALHCRHCDVALTFHRKGGAKGGVGGEVDSAGGERIGGGYAVCHYCLSKTLVPSKCPLCGGRMTMLGQGSQRLEVELGEKFPEARVERLDSDSMRGRDYGEVLSEFAAGRIDILAGTQMLAKGLHFPNVTVVGIVSADTALAIPDFRSGERTFQLISQVAGRSGRGAGGGVVYVQSMFGELGAVKYALGHDYKGFAEDELANRERCGLPPFSRLGCVILRDRVYEVLREAAADARGKLDIAAESCGQKCSITGPVPPAISRIGGYHRLQIVVRAGSAGAISAIFDAFGRMGAVKPRVHSAVDIDPVNLA
jgi:primosomal protein N' (replication factor Y)